MLSLNTPALDFGWEGFHPVGRSLIIADLQPHSLGGHFGIWLNRMVREALKHFDGLAVYVADELSVPDLTSLDAEDREKISIFQIPGIYQSKRFVGDILGVISAHHGARNPDAAGAPLFLMWAQQYIERDLIFPPQKSWLPWRKPISFGSPWGSLTSVSSVAHGASNVPPMEQRIHEELTANPQCEAVFLWDEFAVQKYGAKYLYLPDVEPIESDADWRMPQDGAITVGSVGQLWGHRSMNLLAEILDQESALQGYTAGVLRPESYSPAATDLLEKRGVRFRCEEGFVEDDRELNRRLRQMDAFVIDSRSYKCPSGLGIRAMAMGRPLVAIDTPSWAASLIREEGVGVFWKEGEGALAQKLCAWYFSGGADRSIKAGNRLSDQRCLEKACAEMFGRLKKRSESISTQA
jgi:glycosyltransferase involved in cell wall biosynthesis